MLGRDSRSEKGEIYIIFSTFVLEHVIHASLTVIKLDMVSLGINNDTNKNFSLTHTHAHTCNLLLIWLTLHFR